MTADRRRWLRLGLLVLANLAILGFAWTFHQAVAPGWKKGPLIDPASPYAPENATVLFAVFACVALDTWAFAMWRWPPRRWYQPLLLFTVGLAWGEVVIRLWLGWDMVTYFRPDPVLHWVVRPNLVDFDNLKGGGRITTNADGLRDVDEPRAKPAGEFRVLVLGDSSNFGHGVEGPEAWSAVLERLLEGRTDRPVKVINGATPGWTTFQAVHFLRDTGLAYQPDLVIAGFNNDPGPEYLEDAARVSDSLLVREWQRVLFRFEGYLLTREVLLTLVRRNQPGAFQVRAAGEEPLYGRLSDEEARGLVPRVSLDDFVANLETLDRLAPAFAWIDMPINRTEPDLVARYVDLRYREAAAATAARVGFPLVAVDDRWSRTRETGLFVPGHVFHPSAAGHARMAEQIAADLAALLPGLTDPPPVGGPPPAPTEATLRFGWSSLTPVHAHLGVVLEEHPELAARHGLTLAPTDYRSGKDQGDDAAAGRLDAFFSCEAPAVNMLGPRPDVRVIASVGGLGRIAVVARPPLATLDDLRGRRVGLAPRSTPAMDWETWGAGRGATVVELPTEALLPALRAGTVDAVVGWDPWVEDWVRSDGLVVLAERPFRSVLAVNEAWATREPDRARRLVALFEDALRLAAADRPGLDARVAARSGWSAAVVTAVADRNAALAGGPVTVGWTAQDEADLDRAVRWVGRGSLTLRDLLGLELLQGRRPPGRGGSTSGAPPGKGRGPIAAPGTMPVGVPPPPGSPR